MRSFVKYPVLKPLFLGAFIFLLIVTNVIYFTDPGRKAKDAGIKCSALFEENFYAGSKKTFPFCLDAANKGSIEAQSYLGLMYEKGVHVQKNKQQAIFWYQKVANKGLTSEALSALLEKHAGGSGRGAGGGPYHYVKIVANTQTALAYLYLMDKNFKESTYWCERASQSREFMGVDKPSLHCDLISS